MLALAVISTTKLHSVFKISKTAITLAKATTIVIIKVRSFNLNNSNNLNDQVFNYPRGYHSCLEILQFFISIPKSNMQLRVLDTVFQGIIQKQRAYSRKDLKLVLL